MKISFQDDSTRHIKNNCCVNSGHLGPELKHCPCLIGKSARAVSRAVLGRLMVPSPTKVYLPEPEKCIS